MGDIISALQNTPVPTILVVGGIAFLFLAVIGQFAADIKVSRERQVMAAVMGALLLFFGVALYAVPVSSPDSTSTIAPAQTTTPTEDSSSDRVFRTTCDWVKDWESQSDGSYFWVGAAPGSPNCPNVGQARELLQRLESGEELTLIVEVGDTPMGLDICHGSYKATYLVPGQTCVPDKPELWPKVSGTLTVVGSTGFRVGIGD